MTAELVATIVTVAAVLLLGWLLFVFLPWLIDRETAVPDGAVQSADILERIALECTLRTDSCQLELSHCAPSDPYTPEQAHVVTQQHRECAIELCAAD